MSLLAVAGSIRKVCARTIAIPRILGPATNIGSRGPLLVPGSIGLDTTFGPLNSFHTSSRQNSQRCLEPFESWMRMINHKNKCKKMNPELATAYKASTEYFPYGPRDAIIFAMGVGCRGSEDLRYMYMDHPQFLPLPSFIASFAILAVGLMDWPGIDLDMKRILHGEHYMELYEPLPPRANMRQETRMIDCLDKGAGALFLFEVISYDNDTGRKIAMQQCGVYQMGSGNFGGQRSNEHEKKPAEIPKREPDCVMQEVSSQDQPYLFSLGSSDFNPMHADPKFAQKAGFPGPIMHGLCSTGFSLRHIFKTWADNDFSRFKGLKVRFLKPVLPGQILITETWRESDTRIIFQTKALETGDCVIGHAYVELTSVNKEPVVPERLQQGQVLPSST